MSIPYDAQEIKMQAAGRWPDILAAVGIPADVLDGKNHPCPKCEGTDRFRFIDADAGAVLCNQCFAKGNGDGLAAIQWWTGETFPAAVKLVAEQLGVGTNGKANSNGKPKASYATADDAIASLERKHGELSGRWTYHDATGNIVGYTLRWNKANGEKDIFPLSLRSDGWTVGAMPSPRPLYKLPSLDGATRVYVCEGELAADAATSIGLVATTSAGGCQAPGKANWRPLAGKEIVILPDADGGGANYRDAVAAILTAMPGTVVKCVDLPNLPHKGDIADVLAADDWCGIGLGDAAEPRDLAVLLDKLADEASVFVPETGDTSDSTEAEPARTIEPYKPLPLDVLPRTIRQFVGEASTAIGCDASFVLLPVLACLARAIGNKRVVRLKRTWHEPAIIWAAIVGKSGTHKTPAIQAATVGLHEIQAAAIEKHKQAVQQHEQEQALYERAHAEWKRSTKTTEPPPLKPEAPALMRFIVSDITVEALADRLHRQFDGVAVVRDELAGWLGGIAEYKGGKGSDLGHWLACWSAAPLTVDRKTGAIRTVHVPRAAVNIVGGIQPGVLRSAIGKEHLQDGLCARLLLVMPDTKPVRWTEATVSPETEAAMKALYERLLSLTPAADAEGNAEPFALSMTPAAKAAWIEYYNRHRAELATLDDDLAAAWSKLEAYTARLALIFHLADWAAGDADEGAINEGAMKAAITLSDWFGREAERVYGLFTETDSDTETRETQELVRRLGGRITANDLRRRSRKFSTSEQAEQVLGRLVAAGVGRWEDTESTTAGGRPTRYFVVSE